MAILNSNVVPVLALLVIAAFSVNAQNTSLMKPALSAAAPEPGVAQALAHARAARLSAIRYQLAFDLHPKATQTEASETLTFNDSGSGDLVLDFRDGDLLSAELNRHAVQLEARNGHLILAAQSLIRGQNTLRLTFRANIASAGEAITRYEDKDDGNEYLYTLFVPMDASMAFPCFDQPDLKARFSLVLTHPADWTVVSNTAPWPADPNDTATRTSFPETRPISTYLFAFAAGPFARIAAAQPGSPALYVRHSQLAKAQKEAPEVQATAEQGIRWLSDYFHQPFPFPKYDLVLIPGFPFGGMEHAGASFLNEDGVLFRSAPTASDYFRRDILVLHETTHQWFGDLVTMHWFDDLWLKEGFAQYMAYKAEAALKPETQPWKHFYEDIKPLAYGIDETEGTTPIFQDIPNLKDAKSAYGAIVYQKAPAVLKQLEFRLGPDAFRDGLRLYLQQHSYANAKWSDLIHAFAAAGANKAEHASDSAADLNAWADAWIKHRSMPQVDVQWTCSSGKLVTLTLTQHDILGTNFVWPIVNELALNYAGRPSLPPRTIQADWSSAVYPVKQAIGAPCPSYIFANAGDEAYGRFLIDRRSEPAVARELLHTPFDKQDALQRSQLWGALWDNVRNAKSPPRTYIELALRSLPDENDESLARIQGGRVAAGLHAYLGPHSRSTLLPAAEQVIAGRMLHAGTPGLRIVAFRTFTAIAESPAALAQIKHLLDGALNIQGLELRPLDRWNLVAHLLSMGDPEATKYLAAEKVRDHSGEALKYAFAAEAGTPDAATKASYFAEYLQAPGTPGTRQEDWLSQSLRPFNAWNQQALTLPYLERALDALPDIKRNRKIFFLGAWLGGFLGGQTTREAQEVVNTWLGRKHLDPDLRLKVLESKDDLDRTVRIRQAFPD